MYVVIIPIILIFYRFNFNNNEPHSLRVNNYNELSAILRYIAICYYYPELSKINNIFNIHIFNKYLIIRLMFAASYLHLF